MSTLCRWVPPLRCFSRLRVVHNKRDVGDQPVEQGVEPPITHADIGATNDHSLHSVGGCGW